MTLHPQGWRPKSWFRRTSPPRKTNNGGGGPASPDNYKGNKEDAFCKERLKELDVLSPPEPKWRRQSFFFREKNGLLCRHSVYGRETQVVIPEELKQRLLRYQYQSVLAGHPGSRRMYDTLFRYVY